MLEPQLCDCHLMFRPKREFLKVKITHFGQSRMIDTIPITECAHCAGYGTLTTRAHYEHLCKTCVHWAEYPEPHETYGCNELEIIEHPNYDPETDWAKPVYECWAYEEAR